MNNLSEILRDLTDPDEIAATTLAISQGDIDAAIDGLGKIVANALGDVAGAAATVDAVKQSLSQQKARHDRLHAHASALAAALEQIMSTAGLRSLPQYGLVVRKNPPSVKITGPVPDQYMRLPEPPMPQPHKPAIKAALQEGELLDFAELVQTRRIELLKVESESGR